MNTLLRIVLLSLISLLALSCKKDEPTAPSVQTQYDGTWVGSTSQGKLIYFNVSDNFITGIGVWFEVQTPGCLHVVSLEIDSIPPGISITGNPISWADTSVNYSYMIKGTPNSAASASGTWRFVSFFCGVIDSGTWTATKYTAGGRGSIYVSSIPAGAIFGFDDYFSPGPRVTPDTVKNILVGQHKINFRLSGYRDTAITVTINENQLASISVSLRSAGGGVTGCDSLNLDGNWTGTYTFNSGSFAGQTFNVSASFSQSGSVVSGTITDISHGITWTLQSISCTGNSFNATFRNSGGDLVVQATLSGNTISGTFSNFSGNGTFSLSRQ